jgi:hypothetical protein
MIGIPTGIIRGLGMLLSGTKAMADWLSFYEAVNEIVRDLRVSRGEAEAMLRQACASGKIVSRKEPYSIVNGERQGEGPPKLIEPSEWRDHEIDRMTDSDGCNYSASVDKSDFQYWRNQQRARPQSLPPRQQMVIKYLKEWYPNGVPSPSECPRKNLLGRLRECDRNLKSLDTKTLRSASQRMGNDSNPTVSD